MSTHSGKEADKSAYERWELPVVENEHRGPLTASDLEKIQKQAWDEAYQRGYREGQEKGQQEALSQTGAALERAVQLLETTVDTLSTPLEQIDREITEHLVEMVIAVARHLIRRELRTDPGQVVAVVRESMELLPTGASNIRIFLHPEDAVLVREALSITAGKGDNQRPWEIIDDPVLTRGDCRVRSDHSFIDATLEKRLNRIAAEMLGGEREDDHDER